jgi:hypothetical protein
MKVFFASLTDLSFEIDAWVPKVEQGYAILAALADKHHQHVIIMRARMQRYHNYEERYIGKASGAEVDDFLNRVACMGRDEPTKGDAP